MRYPLEVFRAVRAVWPDDKPISVRISASDWMPDGISPQDAVEVARILNDAGVDMIDVSAGQTTKQAKPVYGRMFQTPFADRVRNEARIATMAVGADAYCRDAAVAAETAGFAVPGGKAGWFCTTPMVAVGRSVSTAAWISPASPSRCASTRPTSRS